MKGLLVLAVVIFGMMETSLFAQRQPEFFKKTKTTIKEPLQLRDPFKNQIIKIKSKNKKKSLLRNGVYTNLKTIMDTPIDRIVVTGVILGKERRAIARLLDDSGALNDKEGQTYIIKEGMIIGENNAEVRAILPGGIVLVEKIRNVYDQDEYIETIIPVFNN